MTEQLSLFAEPFVVTPCTWAPNLINTPNGLAHKGGSIHLALLELEWQGIEWPPTEEQWKAALAAAEYRWQKRSTA